MDLIGQYELYVGHQDIKSARIRCIIEDLRDRGTGELMEMVCKGDTHADAAFSVFVSRMLPEVSPEVCENCIASLQDGVWNRRTRRRCLRSRGIVVHAFCGGAKRAFEHAAHKWDFAHLSIDSAEDLLNDSTYRFGPCKHVMDSISNVSSISEQFTTVSHTVRSSEMYIGTSILEGLRLARGLEAPSPQSSVRANTPSQSGHKILPGNSSWGVQFRTVSWRWPTTSLTCPRKY